MKEKEVLSIKGMSCAACVARIEKVAGKIDGVDKVNVNLATECATVELDNDKTDIKEVINAIEKAGFKAYKEKSNNSTNNDKDENIFTAPFVVSLILTIIILVLSMGAMIPSLDFIKNWQYNHSVQFILSTIVLFWCGSRFYVPAFKNLIHPDMNTLVTLGTFTSWIYSAYLMTIGHTGHLYFEATAVIITFVMLGKNLEKRAKKNVAKSINALFDLSPKTAIILKDEKEVTVNIEDSEELKLVGQVIRTKLYLTPWEAALGTKVNVNGIREISTIYVPAGVQTKEEIVLENKGYKNTSGQRGNLILEVEIVVPKNLTEEEKKLFQKLQEVSKFMPRN